MDRSNIFKFYKQEPNAGCNSCAVILLYDCKENKITIPCHFFSKSVFNTALLFPLPPSLCSLKRLSKKGQKENELRVAKYLENVDLLREVPE